MPISVTCQCGARLEIDEKFLGKEIPCPDCQRPLPTKAPPTPPPLETPSHRRKSGLAVTSLALALALPVVGGIAAIITGILALKQIAKQPNKLEGAGYARAGIVVGGVSLLLGLVVLISPFAFGADQLLRELRMAGKITYSKDNPIENDRGNVRIQINNISPRWAKWTHSSTSNLNNVTDLLILANPTDDAFIACIEVSDINADDPEEKQKKILAQFYQSDLVNIVGELHGGKVTREGTVANKKIVEGNKEEITLDMNFGGVVFSTQRRFLIQYSATEKTVFRVNVGVCRPRDFDRLQDTFREAFKTIK